MLVWLSILAPGGTYYICALIAIMEYLCLYANLHKYCFFVKQLSMLLRYYNWLFFLLDAYIKLLLTMNMPKDSGWKLICAYR